MYNIGFMQGRLSPVIENKIQCFPWQHWENEFKIANNIGFTLLEWTLDQENLYNNPLMTKIGQKIIKRLTKKNFININSLTGDCFMQNPFWKEKGVKSKILKNDFLSIVKACSLIDIKQIIIPLVDNGSIENDEQENELLYFLHENSNFFKTKNIQILFESDYTPNKLINFLSSLDIKIFGINYDTGNSASLGFSVEKEFNTYGNWIKNIHIKDRLFGGGTVPLGKGSVDFNNVFFNLVKIDYKGDFILQTARALDDNHDKILIIYKNLVQKLIDKFLGNKK